MAQAAARKAPRRTVTSSPAAAPYPPSWIDHFMSVVQRFPLPYGLTYLLLLLVEALLLHVVGWIDGTLPPFGFNRLFLVYPLWIWAPLAMMTYLDEVARQALRDFRPHLGKGSKQAPSLEYELTTLPARAIVVVGLFWAGIFVLLMVVGLPVVIRQFHYGPLAIAAAWVSGLFTFVTGGAIYYHTIRQLRLVSTILAMLDRVNLYRRDSLYAFARLTSQTGICWLLLSGATLLIFPFELVNLVVLALYATQAVFALGAFILPLWNVHQRLVAEKRRLLAEVNRRVERVVGQLHAALDGDDLPRAREVDLALGGLVTERKLLAEIPTWPWSTSTLSGFVSAMLLPIALFVIQVAIKSWLGV